ncbi:nuclear factor erythroid 2-related factor 2 [Spea bombifrons]|uniref:nuclear factor erythroid 2-related factor 2 n=1 Tax=Spea bombifrons TaxID=233779 RepID=UPI00234BB080|nr:nuclear factor erythroid 2-related factor 2 [Spea bombifrons]
MTEIALPLSQQSQQDMDLIDILWKQDIDLGVGREVFDYHQRQKEYELEKQKKLEKERLEQLQKEQEQALYTHLQLDEETGEFIPIQHPAPVEPAVSTQALTSSMQSKDGIGTVTALSSEDFINLLTDTFPFVVENVVPSAEYQTWVPDPPIETNPNFLYTTANSEAAHLQNTTADGESLQEMEQAWEELMSIAEMKCLNNDLDGMVNLSMYSNPEYPVLAETSNNYSMSNPQSGFEKPIDNTISTFSGELGGSFSTNIPAVNTNDSFNFCDDLLTLIDTKVANVVPLEESLNQSLSEFLNETVDITDLSLCKAFNGNSPQEFDSDSGISVNTSPRITSPDQSMGSSLYEDAHYGYSDSEMDDIESTPGSVQQNPPEKFTHTLSEEAFYSLSPLVPHDMNLFETDVLSPTTKELPTEPGHNKTPFAKDKSLSRMEARFSRDEQRAKALNIPFSVEKIVNLPVDDFNAMMSKHQFNEAQLALIRDIRRRGKNKVAAQNCRKRKMENIVELESDLDKLKYEKEKLLAEKGEYNNSLHQLKKQIGSLYMEVFGKLRDDDGKPYSSSEYSLQQTKDGNIFLVPKTKKLQIKTE